MTGAGLGSRAYGRVAEAGAVQFLTSQGFIIVATNFTTRLGELDIVAMEGTVLCFVEVKARRTRSMASALQAVTLRKQRRILAAAERYLAEHPHQGDLRFDVAHQDGEGAPWRLLRDAFRAEAL